jgi:hypothetical protein
VNRHRTFRLGPVRVWWTAHSYEHDWMAVGFYAPVIGEWELIWTRDRVREVPDAEDAIEVAPIIVNVGPNFSPERVAAIRPPSRVAL